MSTQTSKMVRWMVTLCIPFMLGFYMITFVIAPWYPVWEYNKAGFPEDYYGWTQEQRLELALVSVDFLARDAHADEVIHLLEEQTHPDSDELLFNQREVDHMYDVKIRADRFKRATTILAIIVVAGITALLYTNRTEPVAYLAIRNGGLATLGILAGIGAVIGLAWDFFFTFFHELLFPPGTWTFKFSDSLIRLFPNKFWFDVGVVIVGLTIVAGAIVALVGHLMLKSAERNRA
ncbi:MAG: DUF1461 domain-containing protein [Candidatus Promineifilaceae bacterium]